MFQITNTFLWIWILVIIIILLLLQNPKNWTISNKYRRIDYMGSLIFAIVAFVFEWLAKTANFTQIIPWNQLWTVTFLGLLLLFSGFINLKYKKEINDYTSYQFGLWLFISWWIVVLYLIIQIL